MNDSHVFIWETDRIETVAAILRWFYKNAQGPESDEALRAERDLVRSMREPITGARFVRRGAE